MRNRSMMCAGVILAAVSGQALAQQGTDPGRPGSRPGDQPGQPSQQPRNEMPGQRPGMQQPGQQQGQQPGGRMGEAGQPGASDQVSQPGEHHRALNWMAGNWTANAMRRSSPGATPQEFQGRMRVDWVLENRFLMSEFMSNDQDLPGQPPFRGLSFIGYNTAGKEYEGTWMDSTSTQISFSTGEYDQQSSTLTLTGTHDNPQSGEPVQTRILAHQESPQRWTWEMHVRPQGGEEYKALEIVFTRADGMQQPGQRPAMGQPGQREGQQPGRPGATPPGQTPRTPGQGPGSPGQQPR